MTERSQPQRTMKLGHTDGFYYIGVKPPLTGEEYRDLPMPSSDIAGRCSSAVLT